MKNSQIHSLLEYLIKNWIAIVSLLFSAYTLWKNRKSITVTWFKDIIEDDLNDVFLAKRGTDEILGSYVKTFSSHIDVVNPSPNDIAFFDLRVFDPDTNINLEFLTSRTVQSGDDNERIYKTQYDKRFYELDIPKRSFGVFKSNSFTRMDIVAVLDLLTEDRIRSLNHIAISFKIAQRAHFFKDSFAVTNRKKFKVYGYDYDITGWQERYMRQLEEQQSQAENSKDNQE